MRQQVRVRLLLLALVTATVVADPGANTNAWRQCLADMSAAAIDACTDVISVDPRNEGAYINRGIAYRLGGALDDAIRDYDEAIRLNPTAADAFNNRANAYRQLDRLDAAVRDYNEALRLNPHYAHAYNNRGVIALERGDVAGAIADFDRAIRDDPSYANAFRNRGIARLDLEQFELALLDFAEAARHDRSVVRNAEYALALFGRGFERRKAGDLGGQSDIDEARRLLR